MVTAKIIIPEIKSPGSQDNLYFRSRSSLNMAVAPSLSGNSSSVSEFSAFIFFLVSASIL
jgi:hypothetical protein